MSYIIKKKHEQSGRRTESGNENVYNYLIRRVDGQNINSPQEALSATGSPDSIPEIGDTDADGLVCKQLDADPAFEYENRHWIVRATYGKATESAASSGRGTGQGGVGQQTRWNTSIENVTLAQALTVTPQSKSFAKTGTAPLSGGVIGWDGEEVKGCTIPAGMVEISITRRYAVSEISSAYLKMLTYPKTRVNSAAWGIWAAKEVLFMGTSGGYAIGGSPAVSGDDKRQLGGWGGLVGATSQNTLNGLLFASFTKVSGLANYNIKIYKDEAMTQLVGSVDMGVVGENQVVGGSGGITGTIFINNYVSDIDVITIQMPMPYEITYNFKISEYKSSKTIGGISVSNKEGWEYADIRYAPKSQEVDGKEVHNLEAAYVYLHEVFEAMDFSQLLINPSEIFNTGD